MIGNAYYIVGDDYFIAGNCCQYLCGRLFYICDKCALIHFDITPQCGATSKGLLLNRNIHQAIRHINSVFINSSYTRTKDNVYLTCRCTGELSSV